MRVPPSSVNAAGGVGRCGGRHYSRATVSMIKCKPYSGEGVGARRGDRRSAPRLRAIPGVVVVAFVLAFSRWGTNLGVPPLYVCDAIIAVTLAYLMLRTPAPRLDGSRRQSTLEASSLVFLVFLGYFALRLLGSVGQAPVLVLLRDGVPFAYGLLSLVGVYGIVRADELARSRTYAILRIAINFHLVWVLFVVVTASQSGFTVPLLGGAPLFELRPDIDTALTSVAAGLALRDLIAGRRRAINIVWLAMASAISLVYVNTRAGQISFVVTIAWVFAIMFSGARQHKARRLAVLLVPIAAFAALAILPSTPAGARLVATLFPDSSVATAAQLNAQGTQRARELVWSGVAAWTAENPVRQVFGGGFGNDFLSESGTLEYLEGTAYSNVRSPHNWFVGIYARLGLIGLGLVVVWLTAVSALMLRRRSDIGDSDLLAVSSMVVVAILPVATLGVVLEAPFGAIPFFWTSGLVMGGLGVTQRRAGHQVLESAL